MARTKKQPPALPRAESYRHPDADLPARPEIGAQAHFKKAKPPATYRFDSSLAPELNWDGQNPAREQGEAILRQLAEAVSSFEFPVSRDPLTPEAQRALALQLETRNSKLGT